MRPLVLLAGLVLAGLSRPLAEPVSARQSPRATLEHAIRLTPPIPIAGLETGPATPLEFSRAWLEKAERVRQRREELIRAGMLDGVAPDSLAKLGAALSGKLRIPVIPVRYSNVPEPFPHTVLEERLSGEAAGDSVGFSSYWREVSGGLLEVEGIVTPWVRLRRSGSHYLPKEDYGWASFGRAHDLVRDVLSAADDLIDYSGFDNDGPDGIPNSGDDDGFVDLVIILYAVPCDGEWREGSVWPHRSAIRPFQTSTRAAGGGKLQVADYLILPVQEPGSCEPLQLGVLAHETGHALGLPDLYDYAGGGQGAGAWDLMGTGGQSAPHSPAHLSAWAKEQLGWVQVDWLRPGQDSVRVPPIVRDRTILRYDLPGPSGEYLLFENRQRLGSDRFLPGTGLLVWRIDPDRAALSGWNGIGRYPGVELVRASGRTTGGGAADDPFPGMLRRDELAIAAQEPLRLHTIRDEGGTITAAVETGHDMPTLLAGAPLRLAVLPGDSALSRTILIQRLGEAAGNWTPTSSAAWASARRLGNLLQFTADPAGLAPGIYTDTIRFVLPGPGPVAATTPKAANGANVANGTNGTSGTSGAGGANGTSGAGGATATKASNTANRTNSDDPAQQGLAQGAGGPERPLTTTAGTLLVQLEVADPNPASPAVVATEIPWGWGLAVKDGELFQASFGRDALSLRPRPRLMRLPGPRHRPETLARLKSDAVYAPIAGPHGSIYLLGQTDVEKTLYQIRDDGGTTTLATIPGATPAYGTTRLADGRILVADWDGTIRQITPDGRVAPWLELGRKIYQIAVDAEGTLFAAAQSGDILRLDPATGRLTAIPTGLGAGRLVAITTAPDGTVYAAERGGLGRILRLDREGTISEVIRISGAEFYGLTADDRFLYAMDLGHRQILRLPNR